MQYKRTWLCVFIYRWWNWGVLKSTASTEFWGFWRGWWRVWQCYIRFPNTSRANTWRKIIAIRRYQIIHYQKQYFVGNILPMRISVRCLWPPGSLHQVQHPPLQFITEQSKQWHNTKNLCKKHMQCWCQINAQSHSLKLSISHWTLKHFEMNTNCQS